MNKLQQTQSTLSAVTEQVISLLRTTTRTKMEYMVYLVNAVHAHLAAAMTSFIFTALDSVFDNWYC